MEVTLPWGTWSLDHRLDSATSHVRLIHMPFVLQLGNICLHSIYFKL